MSLSYLLDIVYGILTSLFRCSLRDPDGGPGDSRLLSNHCRSGINKKKSSMFSLLASDYLKYPEKNIYGPQSVNGGGGQTPLP